MNSHRERDKWGYVSEQILRTCIFHHTLINSHQVLSLSFFNHLFYDAALDFVRDVIVCVCDQASKQLLPLKSRQNQNRPEYDEQMLTESLQKKTLACHVIL